MVPDDAEAPATLAMTATGEAGIPAVEVIVVSVVAPGPTDTGPANRVGVVA